MAVSIPDNVLYQVYGMTMIDDAEIRGTLLQHFHGRRDANGGWCPTDEILLSSHPVSRAAIANACQDLADAGYILWEPFKPPMEQHAIGRARITGTGKDVVTGARVPTIDIRFPAAPGCLAPAPQETPLATGRLISEFLAGPESSRPSAPPPQAAVPTSPLSEAKKNEMVTLKPTLWGIGVDLKEVGRRAWSWWKARK